MGARGPRSFQWPQRANSASALARRSCHSKRRTSFQSVSAMEGLEGPCEALSLIHISEPTRPY